jgi:hypothetical protein
VVAEVALSMVLLVGAGLTLRIFFALMHASLPFDPTRTIYARLMVPRDRCDVRPDRKPAFFRDVLPRIQALPGVIRVGDNRRRCGERISSRHAFGVFGLTPDNGA